MIPNKFSGLSILLILALLISTFAVVMPAAPVQAAIGCTITTPSTGSPVNTNGTAGTVPVNISFSGGDASTLHDVRVYVITSGGTQLGYSQTNVALPVALTPVALPAVGIIGYSSLPPTNCYLVVTVDGTTYATQVGTTTVVISNVTPTVTISMPNGTSGWSGATSPLVNNPLSFSVSEPCSVTVSLTTGTGTETLNGILSVTIPTPPTQMSGLYYTGTLPSTNVDLVGINGFGTITINATDAYGNVSGPIPQTFTILSTGPTATVTNPGTIFNGGTTSTINGTINTYGGTTVSYEIGLFNSNTLNSGDTPASLVDLISGGWQSGTPTGTAYSITGYTWHVENNVTGSNFYIGIRGRDAVGNSGLWYFNTTPFRIVDVVKPTVTITWPTSGSVHYAGSSDNITWTMTDNVPGSLTYNLWLGTYTNYYQYPIAASSHAQGTWWVNPWLIPGGLSGSSWVISENVSDSESPPNVQTVRSNTFSIVSAVSPTASMTAPIGGENWAVGSTQSVTWTQSDTSSSSARLTDTVQFTADGGTHWVTIATLTNMAQSSNTYSWAVANPYDLDIGHVWSWPNVQPNGSVTAANCRISITALNPLSGLSVTTSSPSPFTISQGTSAVTTATVTMQPGWNLISLPLVPTNTNIQNILGSSIGSIASVWTCTGGGSTGGSWSSWAPGLSSYSGLTTMVDGKAYWIQVNGTSPVPFHVPGQIWQSAASRHLLPTHSLLQAGIWWVTNQLKTPTL